jgi:hypothetical protein
MALEMKGQLKIVLESSMGSELRQISNVGGAIAVL